MRLLDLPPGLGAFGAVQGLGALGHPALLEGPPFQGTASPLARRSYEEAYLTNSVREAASLATLDGHPVEDGCPGPVTRLLQRAWRKEVSESRGRR